MKKRKNTALGKRNHFHLWSIPRKYFPRNTKATEYLEALNVNVEDIQFTNREVQYGASVASFCIASINKKLTFQVDSDEVFRKVKEFVYHYENYCQRIFIHREKLIRFINAIMPIGYDDSDVRIKHILINPTIKISGIKSRLEEFSDKKLLFYKIVHDRNQMTHELYFPAMGVNRVLQPLHKAFKDEKDFKTWCKKWKEQVTKRARDADLCTARLSSIDNEIATKIVEYKESLIRVK